MVFLKWLYLWCLWTNLKNLISKDMHVYLTRGALSREHAYATIAFLEQLHHYFGTHEIRSPSYKAYTFFVNKKSLF